MTENNVGHNTVLPEDEPLIHLDKYFGLPEESVLEEFYDYVESFYGGNKPLYPLEKKDDNGKWIKLTREDIKSATKRLDEIQRSKLDSGQHADPFYGDSFDREYVRHILETEFGYTEVENTWEKEGTKLVKKSRSENTEASIKYQSINEALLEVYKK